LDYFCVDALAKPLVEKRLVARHRNLAELELTKLYAPNSLRLVSVHGVLDYLQPHMVTTTLLDIVKVQPKAISIRLFLMGNPWSRNFASIEQLAMELNSIEITTSGLVESIDFDIFCRTGVVQLNILDQDKIEHNFYQVTAHLM